MNQSVDHTSLLLATANMPVTIVYSLSSVSSSAKRIRKSDVISFV